MVSLRLVRNVLLYAVVVGGLCSAKTTGAEPAAPPRAVGPLAETSYLRISGIYPHLATFNQPAEVSDRPNHGECGIGAIVPWADRLWYITYPQHKTTGSNDKLYEVDPEMNLAIRPESVGGTHACRMIHRESNQLIIGPYFIDTKKNVRACDLQELRGRMTAVMRHLTDPANKVYFFDMEGAIYEVDVHSLDVTRLFEKPVPGWHGKGGYTAQGRVVIANNGDHSGDHPAYKHLLVGGPPEGEEAGVLAQWDGETWSIIERKQFTDVTGPGGIHGSPSDDAPLWAVGWDKRSVILKLLDSGKWYTFRMPKSSLTFDPRHGWYTEWPRIREYAPGQPMMCMHGGMFDFPIGFSAEDTSGIRPLCTHLRYIPDFCHWNGAVVLGADDASMMHNPLCGQGQSNLWFGSPAELRRFGPPAGWGGVWLNDPVTPGEPSAPYLLAGYKDRTMHIVHDADETVRFTIEVDRLGDGQWEQVAELPVESGRYRFLCIPEDEAGEWIRVSADRVCRATVFFHGRSPRPETEEGNPFAALGDVTSDTTAGAEIVGGIIRPAAHNRSLQWVRGAEGSVEGNTGNVPESIVYSEVSLSDDARRLIVSEEVDDRSEEVLRLGKLSPQYEVDDASVLVRDHRGRRFRLPKGAAAFDHWVGRARAVREVASERFLANIHGTFYEIPRDGNSPDWYRAKPVCSHTKTIVDFCSWRGLVVLTGTRQDALADGHFFADSQGRGLWFGALDDLWKLGKPRGEGGPWLDTPVQAGEPSDPYMMTNFDRKSLVLSHDAETAVNFTLEVDFAHHAFHPWRTVTVAAGDEKTLVFPQGYHAHWLRVQADTDCRATVQLTYE